MKNTNTKIIQMAQMAMLTAISIILVTFIRFPIIPVAPFLEYDMADVPILLGTLMFGTMPGLIILILVSTIQALFLGGNGWIGLLMHVVASGTLVILVGQFYKRRKKFADTLIGMILGTISMTAIMIPLNLLLTGYFQGVPMQAVIDLILPAIIPFNLIKAGVNCVLSAILFTALSPVINKYGNFKQQN